VSITRSEGGVINFKIIYELDFLVRCGIDINQQDISGDTFLIECFKCQNYELALRLIKLGANTNLEK